MAGGGDALVGELVRLFVLHKANGLNAQQFADAKASVLGSDDPPVEAAKQQRKEQEDLQQQQQQEDTVLINVTRHVYEAGEKTNRGLIASEIVRVEPAASVADAWDTLCGKQPPAAASDMGYLYVVPPGVKVPRELPRHGQQLDGAESWNEEGPQYWRGERTRGFSEKAKRTTCGELFGTGAQICMIYDLVLLD